MSTFTSDTETLTPQPSKTIIDPISVRAQEEGQKKEDTTEDTSDDNSVVSIDDID